LKWLVNETLSTGKNLEGKQEKKGKRIQKWSSCKGAQQTKSYKAESGPEMGGAAEVNQRKTAGKVRRGKQALP